MYNIEVPHTINLMILTFTRLGFWNDEDIPTFRGRRTFFCIHFLIFFLSVAVGAIKDNDEFVLMTVASMIIGVHMLRMWYIVGRKNEILMLIHQIGSHSVYNHEVFIQINKKLNSLMRFTVFYIIISIIGLMFCIVLPIFSSERRIFLSNGIPIDWENSTIGFWMVYICISLGLTMSLVYNSLTMIVWYVMLNCSIKYDILGYTFQNIGLTKATKADLKKLDETKRQKLFLQELILAIKTHQNINELVNEFSSTFANLFSMQIATSRMGICGSVYILAFSSHQNLILDGIYSVILVYNIFDIFMLMYLGNEIKLSSDRLSYRLFQSGWIDLSPICKKAIFILMEVLKQPQELIILKLYPLNLETFIDVLNGAYSMFNILKNLNP